MSHKSLQTDQGHWILARMGKKVLRPGGRELTTKLVENLAISEKDKVVEFAPGLGFTASLVLKSNPTSYTGVELNEDAAEILRKKIQGENKKIIIANASESTLEAESADKVYGEAMLTMQSHKGKMAIIKEAHRILKDGGLYGIHELGLTPDEMPEKSKSAIQKELANVIKVNARPLTVTEWKGLLEECGFAIERVETNSMSLLEKKRMIEDEGLLRTIKIGYNIMTHPRERKHIMNMRTTFRKHKEHLNAIAIVAKKVGNGKAEEA
jgi:ubiquinone/menaquinone biosynthesis C-methylase UbiE